ncbi:MAG: hypothetical protein V4643_08465 [Bacteroidota bacterium]
MATKTNTHQAIAENNTENKNYVLAYKVALTLLFLVGVVLSIKSIKEPDIWWQLATGQWIIDYKTIPTTDVFSFTFFGVSWVNIKWGFEVIIALLAQFFSPASIPVLQVLVSVGILYYLLQFIYLINPSVQKNYWQKNIVLVITLLILANISYRIIGRPEMFSHLFALMFFYYINRFKSNKKIIFILPLIQLLWTNLHEAFGLGLIIIFIYLASEWFIYFKNKTREKPVYLSITAILSILVIAINPYGTSMYQKPLEIFEQLQTNKYTVELSNYTSFEYWQLNTYSTLILLIITFIGFVYQFFQSKRKLFNTIQLIGLGNSLSIIALTILASGAYRNLVFINLLLAPFVVQTIIQLAPFLNKKITIARLNLISISMAIVLGGSFYISVASNYYYTFNHLNDSYGMSILASKNPIGAANFIKQNNLDKEIIFSDYISSSYLLYQLQPHFKSFIDLRDLDVFPDSFFQRKAAIYSYYNEYQYFDSIYHFKAAVVLNSQFKKLQTGLYNDSSYSLAYFDPLVSVFIKKKNTRKHISISAYPTLQTGTLANLFNYTFNPFYKQVNEIFDADIESALYYLSLGDYQYAKELVSKKGQQENEKVSYILGQYYLNKAVADTSQSIYYNDSAYQILSKAVAQNSNYLDAHFSLGVLELNRNNLTKAALLFEQCCTINPDFLNGYLYAAETYKTMLGNGKNTKQLSKLVYYLEKANRMNPNNPSLEWNLGVAYFKQGKCSASTELLTKVKDFEGLSIEDKNTAIYCINNCK